MTNGIHCTHIVTRRSLKCVICQTGNVGALLRVLLLSIMVVQSNFILWTLNHSLAFLD